VTTKRFRVAGREAWERFGDGLLAAGLFVLGLAAYTQTLAPSVAALFDDSLEFPLVSFRLGIAHPTGYPLYTLLGKLFTLAVPHNVAWAVNSLSAVAGALTVALVYLVIRQLARRRLPALLGAVALGVSPLFWSQSVVAEVYTLNAAFVAAVLLLALRWARQPLVPVLPFSLLLEPPREVRASMLNAEGVWLRVPPAVRRGIHAVSAFYRRIFPRVPASRRLQLHPSIYGLAAVYGLSLTHHRLMLLLLPALFIFVLLVERRVFGRAALLGPEHPDRPRWLQIIGRPGVRLALCLFGPLLLYLYLPLRGDVGSLDGAYANTWGGFWRWVTTGGYGAFLGDNPLARDLDAVFYGRLLWQQFGPVGLALSLVGVIALIRRPKVLALTGVAFAAHVVFAVSYRVPDVEVFFIPAFLLVAVWIGVGLDHAASLLQPRGRSLALRRVLAACGLLLFVAATLQPLLVAARHYPDLDRSQQWTVHDYGLYELDQPLPADSTVVGLLGEMTLLRYFQETVGRRADVETVAADLETDRREAVEAALAQGRAVFVTRPLPGLAGDHSLSAVTGLIDVAGHWETLIRVGEPSYEEPSLPRPSGEEVLPGVRLLGYGMREHQAHWQAWARLRLWWQAPEGVAEPLKVSARLVDAQGSVVAFIDAEPVGGAYPATAWRPGEVVTDAYEIPLPSGLPPGDYQPVVILYHPGTGTERGRLELSPVTLAGNPARPPRRALEASVGQVTYARFGDVELLGVTSPRAAATFRAGDTLPLELLWQAWGEPVGELRLAFWLEDGAQVPLGDEPLGGSYTAGLWQDRQVVRQWPSLRIPGGTPPGTYRLRMRVLRDGRPVPWGRGILPVGSDLDLGMVAVGG
jgi:hypothetical protein